MSMTSAPGKLLLLGDHAVVYGRPCIVTAVSQRLYVSEKETDYLGDRRFIDAAVKAWGIGNETLCAKSDFSATVGLGSSSAVTVAALKALRPAASNRELFDAAYKIVLDIQGRGSGFDVAAAIWGGTLYFVTGGKVIQPLNVKDMPLVVGYTGIKADTATLMANVAEKMKVQPERVERIYDAIAKLVEEAKMKMLNGDWEQVGKLMDFNQEYLRDLGVSSEKLEALISAAKAAGAWGAKLSGAGGGDCMIALHPDGVAGKRRVEEAVTKAGGQVIHITTGAPGVRRET